MILLLTAASSGTRAPLVFVARRTGAGPPGLYRSAAVRRRARVPARGVSRRIRTVQHGVRRTAAGQVSAERPRGSALDVVGHLRPAARRPSRTAASAAAGPRARARPARRRGRGRAVQHVGLDPALGAVEGRVGADRDGGRQPRVGRARPAQLRAGPATRRTRRRRAPRRSGAGPRFAVGIAQLAAAVVAVHDDAARPGAGGRGPRRRRRRRPRRAARGPRSRTSAGRRSGAGPGARRRWSRGRPSTLDRRSRTPRRARASWSGRRRCGGRTGRPGRPRPRPPCSASTKTRWTNSSGLHSASSRVNVHDQRGVQAGLGHQLEPVRPAPVSGGGARSG